MKNRINLIFGKTGTGKSTLAKQLVKDETRVIIIDAKAEYTEGMIVYSLTDCYFYINNKKSFTVICRFDNELEIEYLFKFVKAVENICLVVEEAEIYISPYAKRSSFLDLVRYGRHHNIKIIGIARRTSELSIDFRAMTDVIYTFKQTEPADILNMQKLGIDGVENLGEHEHIEIIL